MPRSSRAPAVYPAAEQFVDRCLRRDDSLFQPGRTVWATPVVDEAYGAFVDHPDTGNRDFIAKLNDQLADCSDDAKLLMAELLYFHLVGEADSGGDVKRERIGSILGWMSEPAQIPDDLAPALDRGIASSAWARNRRDAQVAWLLEFSRRWKELPSEQRDQLMADPWAFESFVHALPKHSASIAIEATLHLVFPDTFEDIFSVNIKEKVAAAFDQTDASILLDRRLHVARQDVRSDLGSFNSFYDDAVRPKWDPPGSSPQEQAWASFVDWAAKLFTDPSFDAAERHYKLAAAENVAHAREAVAASAQEWLDTLRKAFAAPNNETNWRGHGEFLNWCTAHPDEGRTLLVDIWTAEPDQARMDAVLAAWPAANSPGNQLTILSFLLGGLDKTRYPVFRARTDAGARRLLLLPRNDNTGWNRYEAFLALLDELAERLQARDIPVRDRLDVQGLVWWIVNVEPPSSWDETEKSAFRTWRGENVPPGSDGGGVGSTQRAWHLRSWTETTDDWFSDGCVSIFYTSLGPLTPEVSPPELSERLRAAYPDYTEGRVSVARANITRFMSVMQEGDLVTTSIGNSLFIGTVTSAPFWAGPEHRWSAQRRSVEWLNVDSPADLTAIPSRVAARTRMPNAVVEIPDVDDVAALVGLAETPERPRLQVPAVRPELADGLFVDVDWLQEIVDLLSEKRQVVFYGPPGTGKTLVAQRLAEHLTAAGGEWHLVQFHPSYSYEDFMEGYRPVGSDSGNVSYELRPGPLRRIAEAAHADPGRPHVLIVDEINRGNIPKIFGELLYLLEYRDRAIELQYSDEPFLLPPNLLLIGTMNTADRSIALVDAALRRRFFFVPFMPTEAPVDGVLRRWLESAGRDVLPALLLDELNRRIAKDEVAIGPSYFMTGDGGHDSLRRIWRHAILPLLDEHFYGTKVVVHKELSFDACLTAVTSVAGVSDDAAVDPRSPADVEVPTDVTAAPGEPPA